MNVLFAHSHVRVPPRCVRIEICEAGFRRKGLFMLSSHLMGPVASHLLIPLTVVAVISAYAFLDACSVLYINVR